MKKLIIVMAILLMTGQAGAGTAKIDWQKDECSNLWKSYHERIKARGNSLVHIPSPDCPHPQPEFQIDGKCPVCDYEVPRPMNEKK